MEIRKALTRFKEKYWDLKGAGKPTSRFYGLWSLLVSTIKGFLADRCSDKSSTLTFYTLLSIVPLIAIGFGIAQELGFAQNFVEQIKSQFSSQPQVAEKIIEFAAATLKTTKGSIIATFGIVILIWTVLSMIGYVATYFDEIWKVKQPRTLWGQIKSFVPLILLFPIFLAGTSSFFILVSSEAILATQSFEILHYLGPFIRFFLDIIPYLVSFILLTFLYMYLPHTKVSWKAGLIAGFTIGILFAFWQWIYVIFQVKASSYGAIYGSFAAFPLFLIWLNYSWLLVLFGAELAYHIDKK